jgi:uncharacterized protein YcfJ
MWIKSATKSLAVAAALSVVATGSAVAGGKGHGHDKHHHHHAVGYRVVTPVVVAPPQYVYARVVDVDPMVRYVTVNRPREECWSEVVREPARPFGVAGQTAAGGIIGAAIGRQFGSGNDRDALTLLGAAAGAAVANQRAIRNGANATRDVAVQRCEVVNERVTEERIDGYLVTYNYQGRNYTMQTATPPGDRVRLAVDVQPVGYQVRY